MIFVKFCFFIIFYSKLSRTNGWQFWEKPLELAKPNQDGIYEFDLWIRQALTMTTNPVDDSSMVVDYSPENLTWSQRDPNFRTKCTENMTILHENSEIDEMDKRLETLLQWDGMHRKIITINGKSPGEPIVVPLGAKIVMRIRNRLQSQSITVHIHGMNQRNRWFMDGTPQLAQCPIGPGNDFTYKFIADTPGTHWYHGHLMGDRAMGLFSGFVVMRPDERKRFITEEAGELAVGREYYSILQNWHPESVEDTYLDMWEGRAKWMGKNVDSGECIQKENAGPPRTGPFFGYLRTMTILVNQKGWHRHEDILTQPSALPLANFGIRKNENILLRLVNGGNEESFYIWIEDHDFWVVAADGAYVKPKMVDSLTIHPGERYDLLIKGLEAPKKMPYYLIIESFEQFMGNISENRIEKMYGLATLRYQDFGARTKLTNLDSNNVDFFHQKCTQSNICHILNCPHANFYTIPRNYTCLTNRHLENDEFNDSSNEEILEQKMFDKNNFQEIMLNVHAGLDGWYFKRANGIPYFHQENLQEIVEFCDPKKCDRWTKHCQCFHHYEFGLGNIVQMTLATWANMLHPFHLHGTKFYVVQTGIMGDNYTMNDDLECAEKEKYCLSFKWRNGTFNGGNIPGMHRNPVLRDTIMIPSKGYVTIRFRATNPGWFFGHCHLLYHAMDGMSFAYKVDSKTGPSIIPSPPPNFPINCGHFEGQEDWAEINQVDGKNSSIQEFWPNILLFFCSIIISFQFLII